LLSSGKGVFSSQSQSNFVANRPKPSLRDALLTYYKETNPEKATVQAVDKALRDYKGGYDKMIEKLEKKYHKPFPDYDKSSMDFSPPSFSPSSGTSMFGNLSGFPSSSNSPAITSPNFGTQSPLGSSSGSLFNPSGLSMRSSQSQWSNAGNQTAFDRRQQDTELAENQISSGKSSLFTQGATLPTKW